MLMTLFMLDAEPTEVPPNFNTFMNAYGLGKTFVVM